ncbi:MAG: septum formation inhibitor Maf [Rubrivivax sp.]|nr:MAG: septum formation inhibitor Maf [Rubrivivax sp.]
MEPSPTPAALPRWLYLASQSPRRRQLLDQLGVAHRLLLPQPDEDAESLEAERPGESPDDYVRRVTLAKWEAARDRLRRLAESGSPADWPPAAILCADTTVALGADILGKPRDAVHAAEMLSRLSGQTHRVLTAVVIDGHLAVSESNVVWRGLSTAEIDGYVDSGEPMGKAGAYAIQSRAAAWTQRIDGSYSGIMGLPLFETAELLRPLGWAV